MYITPSELSSCVYYFTFIDIPLKRGAHTSGPRKLKIVYILYKVISLFTFVLQEITWTSYK